MVLTISAHHQPPPAAWPPCSPSRAPPPTTGAGPAARGTRTQDPGPTSSNDLEECFVSGARFDRGVHRDAVARVVAGESAAAVARDVGCRRGTVSQWCRDAGWSWSGGVRAGLLRLTRPDAPESSRPSWVGRACPRPQPPLGCVGSRRAGTGTIRPWRQHQQHQHGSRGGAPTACRAAPARDGSGAASVSVTLSGF